MPNFWESNPGPAFHGHLKLGEAQQAGYDVHGTFPRDGKLPHISVYEVSSTGGKVMRNLYLRNANGTVGLKASDRALLLKQSGVSESIADAFVRAVYDKHRELNPVSSTPSSGGSGYAINNSDFPPLMASRPVATTPAMQDPVQKQLDELPDVLRSVMMGSGAFD